VNPQSRAKAVFLEALAIDSPDEREAFLCAQCEGDPDLLERVRALIQADEQAGVLDQSLASLLGSRTNAASRGPSPEGGDSAASDQPLVLDRYEIIREIGTGGMGVVYEARQSSPNRRVAIKVLAGASGAEGMRRFLNEAEILARLEHPNIAHVFEAGTRDDGLGGRPFFAMELIENARPLDRYVREEALPPEQIVETMLKVCDAVHHAHQRGVIHRDIKPTNVLVGANGEPKVIDFGVARIAGDAEISLVSMATSPGQLIGTLRYMSPEQFGSGGKPAESDARSDVYALGLLLHECLTGSCPYPIDDASPYDIPRIIREYEPGRLTVHRSSLRGDLQTIVLKAMAKDPERRYQTVDALAADLAHYLRGEPIEARRDHALYLLRKSLARYRIAIAVGAGFLFLSTASAITFAVLFDRAETARAETAAKNEELEWTNYRNLIALAQGALDDFTPREARELLARCPERLRGWEWGHLMARSDDSVHVFRPGPPGIHTMGVIGDGRRVVLNRGEYVRGGYSGTVEVWDRLAGTLERTLLEHNEPIYLAISFDGSKAVAGANDRRGWVFDLETGEILSQFNDLEFRCTDIEFLHDNRSVLVLSGGVLSKYDVTSGERVASVKAHDDWMSYGTLSPDGSMIATGATTDTRVRVWDVETLAPVAEPGRHSSPVKGLAFAPAQNALFTCSEDGVIKRWNTETWSLDHLERSPPGVQGMSITPDGTPVVFSGTSARFLDDEPVELRGHNLRFSVGSFIGTDGRLLTYDAESVREWERDNRGGVEVLGSAGGDFFGLCVSPDGRFVASANELGQVVVWDARQNERVASWHAHDHRSRTLAFSPDGSRFATGSDDRTVALWSTDDWSLEHRLDVGTDWVRNLAWSADGSILVVGKDSTGVEFWNPAAAQRLASIEIRGSRTGNMGRSADGRYVAVGDELGTMRVIDIESMSVVRELDCGDVRVHAEFMGDGERLLVCDNLGSIQVWNWRTGDMVRSIAASSSPIHTTSVSPDGQRLVVGTHPREPVVWDARTWEPLARIDAGDDSLHACLFAPDGERVFAGRGTDVIVLEGARSEPLRGATPPD